MNELELLEDLGNVKPAEDETIEAAVELVLTAAFQERSDSVQAARRPRHRRRVFAGAVLVTAAATTIVIALVAPSDHGRSTPSGKTAAPPSTTAKFVAPVVLTAATIHRIASSSTAALAHSGTAAVTTTTTTGSQPPEVDTTEVTFSGHDLNYSITTSDNPGATAINRLIDGQFYLYVIGQDLQYHWYHDTSANAASSLAFPDPRTLVGELSPAAGFVNLGTATIAGVALTHYRATDPAAASTTDLKNFVSGGLTGLDLWVDSSNVVQRITVTGASSTVYALSPAANDGSCPAGSTPLKPKANAPKSVPQPADGKQFCSTPETSTTTTDIEFANLGTPESITTPTGAIDQETHG